MTDSEAQIRRVLSMLEQAFPARGGGKWPRERFEAWAKALDRERPDDVDTGASVLVREWTHQRDPRPGDLLERVSSARRERESREAERRRGPQPARGDVIPGDVLAGEVRALIGRLSKGRGLRGIGE